MNAEQMVEAEALARNQVMNERARAVRHEDLLVDEETGQILQWPTGAGADRHEYLMAQHRDAAEQADLWTARRQTLSRALMALLDEASIRTYAGTTYKATRWPDGETKSATVARAREALQWKVINREQYDALVERCAKDLDWKGIEELVDSGLLDREQADYLINRTPRAGHVRTAPVLKAAPEKRPVEATG